MISLRMVVSQDGVSIGSELIEGRKVSSNHVSDFLHRHSLSDDFFDLHGSSEVDSKRHVHLMFSDEDGDEYTLSGSLLVFRAQFCKEALGGLDIDTMADLEEYLEKACVDVEFN